MHKTSAVHLSNPCSIASDQFIPLSNGSYCQFSEKQVVDYTSMGDRELIYALRLTPSGCGSFRKDQLDRPLIENELVRRGYSLAAIALLLALQLCSLEVNGQSISPNEHIGITSSVSSKSGTNNNTVLTIRECKVIDQEGYPLSYATIAILNQDSIIIGGEVTDSSGTAVLKLSEQAVSARVSYVGYQHQEIRLEELEEGLIELFPLSAQLPEATVTAHAEENVNRGFSSGVSYLITKKEVRKHDFHADPTTKLTLFPNPSTGQSTLKSELFKEAILINVYSSVSQLVMSVPITNNTNTPVTLQLSSNFPCGAYIVELVLKNGTTETIKWMVAQ